MDCRRAIKEVPLGVVCMVRVDLSLVFGYILYVELSELIRRTSQSTILYRSQLKHITINTETSVHDYKAMLPYSMASWERKL